jgi:hypothetical protein
MPRKPTPTEKVKSLLEEEGFSNVVIYPVSGYWKSQDVMRWEGFAEKDGVKAPIGSWFTLTDCARKGITVQWSYREYCHVVSAKSN